MTEDGSEQPGGKGATEFKPVVKVAACALLAAAVLGSGYVLFNLGYNQGYREASASEKVAEALNEAAVRNLTNFMQSSTASDDELEAMVQDPDTALSWIQDERIRREAEWLLAQSLTQRGRVEHAVKLLSGLFRKVPKDAVWARRALNVGDAMVGAHHADTAAAFYRYASDIFAAEKSAPEQAAALSRIATAAIAAGKGNDDLLPQLEEILKEAAPLGDEAATLISSINVYLGNIHRATGNQAAADHCYAEALKSTGEDGGTLSPAARVCRGAALLVKGERDRAEELLSSGESALGNSASDTLCRVFALRELAAIAEERGNHLQALGLLNRAEGLAEGAVPRTDFFWPCLYGQRAWVQLLLEQYSPALTDFNRVLEGSREPALRVQALEGAGRCLMNMQRAAEATPFFNDCLNLRTKQFADDKESLARAWILAAQSYEPQKKPQQAASAYAQALSLMTVDSGNYRAAAFGRAKALADAGLWQQSMEAWQNLAPVVAKDDEDSLEVQEAIAACMQQLNPNVTAPVPAPDATAAPAVQPAQAAQPTRTKARRTSNKRATRRRR